jgi:cytochrome c551/c552
MTVAAGLMVAGSAMATDMPELAKKNTCTTCHTIEKKLVGPAWAEVAKKYKGATNFTFKGKEYPLVEGLVLKVSQGGAGNWGTVPMTPLDPAGKKQDQIKELVEFILALNK